MAEQTIWTGRSSQLKNAWAFFWSLVLIAGIVSLALLSGPALGPAAPLVLALAALPAAWMLWRWLQVRARVYQLTSERLLITHGVFNKVQETLELYRVRDLQTTSSFLQRMFGLQSLNLITSDSSTPELILDHVAASAGLPDHFRMLVEECRRRKRVREIDVE
jgi:uncharacterized membrane protein YdbT with pleckstrin-like domain